MYGLVKSLLFQLDPEIAHEFAASAIRRLGEITPLREAVAARSAAPIRPKRLWGLEFPSPVGLAAGFDKNADMIQGLAALGFGFLEVGTVTLRPQRGNPRPRLFRVPSHGALINRMGFNNDGAEAVAQRLRVAVERRGTGVKLPPILVNVGKNREVEAMAAARAYADCYAVVGPWADGAVINVSSPNTPNLRDLQRPSHLREILEAVRDVREKLRFAGPPTRPILVKIAPDLHPEELEGIAAVCVELADGMIATNTTIDHAAIPPSEDRQGGLSGRPLFRRSTEVLAELRRLCGAEFPLIGVGGIDSPEAAREKLAAGADLVQVYTGFIYEGPFLARRLAEELS